MSTTIKVKRKDLPPSLPFPKLMEDAGTKNIYYMLNDSEGVRLRKGGMKDGELFIGITTEYMDDFIGSVTITTER